MEKLETAFPPFKVFIKTPLWSILLMWVPLQELHDKVESLVQQRKEENNPVSAKKGSLKKFTSRMAGWSETFTELTESGMGLFVNTDGILVDSEDKK
ncbi:hypothetical protein TURU_053069 [Turdus rufiventris]|nr:hypothetical protein TURU_053069 [Turdus rufiventris]